MNKQQEELRKKSPVQIKNRKAAFEYFFIEEFTAGIVLTGTEIKSIRAGKASLVDTYCTIIRGEMWVKGMSISPYFYGSYNNHEQKRDRKLLLTRRATPSCPHWCLSMRTAVPRWTSRSARVRKPTISARR